MKRDWDVIREVLIEIAALTGQKRYQVDYGVGDAHPADDRAKVERALLLWNAARRFTHAKRSL